MLISEQRLRAIMKNNDPNSAGTWIIKLEKAAEQDKARVKEIRDAIQELEEKLTQLQDRCEHSFENELCRICDYRSEACF